MTKVSQIRQTIIWNFFRQIEGVSARLSQNVIKLSRIFRYLILTYFLLNSYPKLAWTSVLDRNIFIAKYQNCEINFF